MVLDKKTNNSTEKECSVISICVNKNSKDWQIEINKMIDDWVMHIKHVNFDETLR